MNRLLVRSILPLAALAAACGTDPEPRAPDVHRVVVRSADGSTRLRATTPPARRIGPIDAAPEVVVLSDPAPAPARRAPAPVSRPAPVVIEEIVYVDAPLTGNPAASPTRAVRPAPTVASPPVEPAPAPVEAEPTTRRAPVPAPDRGPDRVEDAAVGAAIGAGVGAVLGGRRGAVRGAIGGAVGGAVGGRGGAVLGGVLGGASRGRSLPRRRGGCLAAPSGVFDVAAR